MLYGLKIPSAPNIEFNYFQAIEESLSKILLDKDIELWALIHDEKIPETRLNDKKKIILITSQEDGGPTPDYFLKLPNVLGIFRQYCPNLPSETNVYPLPLGMGDFKYRVLNCGWEDRPFDYIFIGSRNVNDRHILESELNRLQSDKSLRGFVHFYDGWNKGFKPEIYYHLLFLSKVAIVPNGYVSSETFRFFEAVDCLCKVLTTPRPGYWYYKNFNGNTTNNWFNLKEKIQQTMLCETPSKYRLDINPLGVARYIYENIKNKI